MEVYGRLLQKFNVDDSGRLWSVTMGVYGIPERSILRAPGLDFRLNPGRG